MSEDRGSYQDRIRKVSANFASLSGAQIISQALGFVATAYVARVLGATAFGMVVFAEVLFGYFALASTLGINTIGTRDIAKWVDRRGETLVHVLLLRSLLSLASLALLVLMCRLTQQSLQAEQIVLLYGLVLIPNAFILDWYFQGLEQMHVVAIVRVVEKILRVGLLLLLVRGPEGAVLVPAVVVATCTIHAVLIAGKYFQQTGVFAWHFHRGRFMDLLWRALPLGMANLMVLLYYSIDTVMLQLMRSTAEVGWYNAAYKILYVLIAFASMLGTVVLPTITSMYYHSPDELRRFVGLINRITLLIGLPVVAGVMATSESIIGLIYGTQYSQSGSVLFILAWSVFTIYASVPFTFMMLAAGKNGLYLRITCVGAAMNIALNAVLIPLHGMVGAAISTVITETCVVVLLIAFAQSICRTMQIQKVLQPVLASCVMGIIVYRADFPFIPAVFLGVFLYIILVLLTKGVSIDELKSARSLVFARR